MQDLNLRLLAPKASVLPNCTNSRARITRKVITTAMLVIGGLNEIRTHDLLVANEAFFQLNYKPMVAEAGLEPASKWL